MKKRAKWFAALLLCLGLAACGRAQSPAPAESETGGLTEDTEPKAVETVEPSFPLIAESWSRAESEAMLNTLSGSHALLDGNLYYTDTVSADGSHALVCYTVLDSALYDPKVLAEDCEGSCLTWVDGRLYVVNTATDTLLSMNGDGTDCRAEFGGTRSIQVLDGRQYQMLDNGSLLLKSAEEADNNEELLRDCAAVFVSHDGIFYRSRIDGCIHRFETAARTDMVLTEESEGCFAIIDSKLYYVSAHTLYYLDLMTGERLDSRTFLPDGAVDFYHDKELGWVVRGSCGGTEQLTPLDKAFTGGSVQTLGEHRACVYVSGSLRTDALYRNGELQGYILVRPDGVELPYLAEEE